MRQLTMEVSPAVFSEMQKKATECWAEDQIWPDGESFAHWANDTFGIPYQTEVKVVVRWELGNDKWWSFPENAKSYVKEWGLL